MSEVQNRKSFDLVLKEHESYLSARAPRMTKLVPKIVSAGYEIQKQIAAFAFEAQKNPRIAECSPQSIAMALYTAAALGLEIGSSYGHAYLVPYSNDLQLIPGYRGLIALMTRCGAATSVWARAVYEQDAWEWEEGASPILTHKPSKNGNRGNVVATYACAKQPNGDVRFVVMLREEIETIRERALSRVKNKDRSPWVTDPIPMSIKCPIRRLPNQLAITMNEDSRPLVRAIAVDEARELGADDREVAHIIEAPKDELAAIETTGTAQPTTATEALKAKVVDEQESEPVEMGDVAIEQEFSAEASAAVDNEEAAQQHGLPPFDDGAMVGPKKSRELLAEYGKMDADPVKERALRSFNFFMKQNGVKSTKDVTDEQAIAALSAVRAAVRAH